MLWAGMLIRLLVLIGMLTMPGRVSSVPQLWGDKQRLRMCIV